MASTATTTTAATAATATATAAIATNYLYTYLFIFFFICSKILQLIYSAIHHCATNQFGLIFEFSAFQDVIRNAELRPQWHRITQAFEHDSSFMSWHLVPERWYGGCLRYGIHSGPSCLWPIPRVSPLISGARLSHGLHSCKVAPLCLLRLEVRTGRLVGPVGMNCRCHMVSDLFQTCFRPAKTVESKCAFGSCPQKPSQEVKLKPDWRCRRHGEGWYVSTAIYLPVFLSFSSFSISTYFDM